MSSLNLPLFDTKEDAEAYFRLLQKARLLKDAPPIPFMEACEQGTASFLVHEATRQYVGGLMKVDKGE